MLLCCNSSCMPECSDWIIFGLGVLVTVGWAIYLYSLRPKIIIANPSISEQNKNKCINVPILNDSTIFRASRILIEIAIVQKEYTYHLKSDIQDFAFLPRKRKNEDPKRVFKAYKPNDFLTTVFDFDMDKLLVILNQPDSTLRIRVHATHSFSGLGKAFEQNFKYINSTFKKINNKK